MKCSECDHPAHDGVQCEHVPWDGNPYGLACDCPGVPDLMAALERSLGIEPPR